MVSEGAAFERMRRAIVLRAKPRLRRTRASGAMMTSKHRALASAVVLLGCACSPTRSAHLSGRPGNADDCREPRRSTDVENPGDISRLHVVQAEAPLAFEFGGRRETLERNVPLGLIDQPSLLPDTLRPLDNEPLAIRVPRLVEHARTIRYRQTRCACRPSSTRTSKRWS